MVCNSYYSEVEKKKLLNQFKAERINGVDIFDRIFDVIVPKEAGNQIRNGKRKIVEAKIFKVCLG